MKVQSDEGSDCWDLRKKLVSQNRAQEDGVEPECRENNNSETIQDRYRE